MKKNNIVFQGYRRDCKISGLPTYSGIYIVYRCTFNQEKQTVSLKELLYIGKAGNIQERISEHDKRPEFIDAAKEDEQICYSYAKVDKQDLDIVENALIFAQKPRLNDKLKDSYNHKPAQFNIEGRCALLNYTDFSIEYIMNDSKQPTVKKHRSYRPKRSTDTERLILYADFMGFKNRVLGEHHKKLKKELIDFHNKWVKRTSPLKAGGHLQFVQFSDSILIAVNGVDEKKFNLLSKAAICLMHVAMSMQLPIKGVIAQGTFSYDKENELYFGKPLVDAYLLHEELKYYGIVVHNTAEKTIKKYRNSNNPYTNTPIYIERGRTAHYHLCWNLINQQLAPENITPQCKKWIEDIAERVSGYPRIYVDRTIEILEEDEKNFSLEEEHNAE